MVPAPDSRPLPRPAPGNERLTIGFVLSRAFTLSAFALFVDTLRLAGDELDRSRRMTADWQVLGSTRHLITSSCGVQVAPTSDFTDPCRFDYIVVVGGLLTIAEPVDAATLRFLHEAAAKGVPLIGLCTGSFILAGAGLMKAHETCVSWLHHAHFKERFPDLRVRSDRLYNLDRHRGSCAGGSSAVDLAALIVRRHISREAARNALEVLQVERARTIHDIQPRRPLAIECEDARVKAALIHMENHIDKNISIAALATRVGLSRRQLERLFLKELNMPLGAAYRKIRLERARSLVTETRTPMIEIAMEFGFQSTAAFARNFRKQFGATPASLRAHARGAPRRGKGPGREPSPASPVDR